MDTKGTRQSVRIKRVNFRENVWAFKRQDKQNCPQYPGVRIKWVSIPLPKCAIWHKKQLRAQYLVNLCEICTTRRSWKDLQIKGLKTCPPPKSDLIYHPSNFLEFFPLYIKGPVDILQQAMHWELQIKL